jgi:hypothetical protein
MTYEYRNFIKIYGGYEPSKNRVVVPAVPEGVCSVL